VHPHESRGESLADAVQERLPSRLVVLGVLRVEPGASLCGHGASLAVAV
jgi:hypothetical protein